MDSRSPLLKSMRKPNAYQAHFSHLFKVATDGRLRFAVIKFSCMDYIPPILLKHVDRCLMIVLVWVHFSMMYRQNESLKTNFGLGGQ